MSDSAGLLTLLRSEGIPVSVELPAFTQPLDGAQLARAELDGEAVEGCRPRTVFMDVDWTYSVPYITEVLRRHKPALAARGVQMGINVVEASLSEQEELFYDGQTLSRRADLGAAPNALYGNTLVAIMEYLRGSGVYEEGMQIRVSSWSHRPAETGTEISEATVGSLAHTANRISRLLEDNPQDPGVSR